jgi:hypothetical protein
MSDDPPAEAPAEAEAGQALTDLLGPGVPAADAPPADAAPAEGDAAPAAEAAPAEGAAAGATAAGPELTEEQKKEIKEAFDLFDADGSVRGSH